MKGIIMKEHFENAKKFVVDHKYEFTIGVIAVGAIGALAAVKLMSGTDVEIESTDVAAIENVPDDVDPNVED